MKGFDVGKNRFPYKTEIGKKETGKGRYIF